jgi:hypothetical protein
MATGWLIGLVEAPFLEISASNPIQSFAFSPLDSPSCFIIDIFKKFGRQIFSDLKFTVDHLHIA